MLIKKISRLVLLSWALVALAASVTAQSPRVVDWRGNGLPDIEITAQASCYNVIGSLVGSQTKVTKTDAQGYFSWDVESPPSCAGVLLTEIRHNYTLRKEGLTLARAAFDRRIRFTGVPPFIETTDNFLPLIYAMTNDTPTWAAVSSAHYRAPLTSEMIAAGFGSALANETALATQLPLATTLGNRRVLIKDATGIERAAKLLFISPTQINFIMPSGAAAGAAVVRVTDSNNATIKVWVGEIVAASLGIFAANANGRGVPAGQLVRVKPGNVQSVEPLAQFDAATGRFVPLTIDFGPADNELYLVLYGTGFRRLAGLKEYSSLAGEVTYLGPQPTLEGLDQINLKLYRELRGRGDTDIAITSGNLISNIIQLRFK